MQGKALLTQASAGVTVYDTSGGAREKVFDWLCPKGVGAVIKGIFHFKCRLHDAETVQMPNETLLRFVYYGSDDSIWSYPIGNFFYYQPWGTVSLEKQADNDYRASLLVDLGCEAFPIIEDETLSLEIYHASATLDSTYTQFYIEYLEIRPEELRGLLKQRRNRFGR